MELDGEQTRAVKVIARVLVSMAVAGLRERERARRARQAVQAPVPGRTTWPVEDVRA